MNHRHRALLLAFTTLAAATSAACVDPDPCGEGQFERADYRCAALPTALSSPDAADGGSLEAAADAPGEPGEPATVEAGAAAAPSGFGKACAAMSDCSSDAPICAAPKLPYCTQINCEPGEANAGSCPAGFTCVRLPGLPSGCLQDE